MTSASSASEAKKLQHGLISTLKKAQFDLRKLASSDPELVLSLPPEYREANENFKFLDEENTIKTLGVVWNPLCDKFRFTISKSKSLNAQLITKRQMVSDIAQPFDTLGWLTPVIISMKCLMQKAWIAKLDWDQKLPVDLSQEYVDWREKLNCIETIELSRFVLKMDQLDIFDLHVFCDASELGYSACVFVVSQNNG